MDELKKDFLESTEEPESVVTYTFEDVTDLSESPHNITNQIPIETATTTVPYKKKRHRLLKAVSMVVIFTFLGGTLFGGGYVTALYFGDNFLPTSLQANNTTPLDGNVIQINQVTPLSATDIDSNLSAPVIISKEVGPSVVTITSTLESQSNNPFSRSNYAPQGSGSGIIFKIDQDFLYVVTNHHVIDGAIKVDVTLMAGDTYPAQILGYDSSMDVAVLAIDLNTIEKEVVSKISIANFGDSDALQVGEMAVAIGSPLGKEFSNSVTVGVISSKERILNIEGRELKLIQTDAAINPGNSGGALVNASGQIIGINTAKHIDTDVEGMGFAIPINIAAPLIKNILENKDGTDISTATAPAQLSPDRPFLGVGVDDINSEIYEQTGMPFGVYVTSVYLNSGAQIAGLQVGDVIFAINDEKVLSAAELIAKVATFKVNDTIKLSVARNNKMLDFNAKLLKYSDVIKE